jgi:predicted deacylase
MQKWQDIKVDLKNKMGGCGLDSSGSGPRDMIGSCDHGNELPGSIKCMELN